MIKRSLIFIVVFVLLVTACSTEKKETPKVTTEDLAISGISFSKYYPLFEYLEYGETVEYCQYYDPQVHFYFPDNTNNGEYVLNLDPPEYRALRSKFDDMSTSQTKDWLEIETSEYNLHVELSQGEIIGIDKITDSSNNLVWERGMTTSPRELNSLEKAWIDLEIYSSGIYSGEDIFLDSKYCESSIDNSMLGSGYSVLEVMTRSRAMKKFLQRNSNIILISSWGGDYVSYRLLDKYGNLIKPIWSNSSGYIIYRVDDTNPKIQKMDIRSLATDQVIEDPSWEDLVTINLDNALYIDLHSTFKISIHDRELGLVNLDWDILANFSQFLTEEEILYYYHTLN